MSNVRGCACRRACSDLDVIIGPDDADGAVVEDIIRRLLWYAVAVTFLDAAASARVCCCCSILLAVIECAIRLETDIAVGAVAVAVDAIIISGWCAIVWNMIFTSGYCELWFRRRSGLGCMVELLSQISGFWIICWLMFVGLVVLIVI